MIKYSKGRAVCKHPITVSSRADFWNWRKLVFRHWDLLFAERTRILSRNPSFDASCMEDVLDVTRELAY